MSATFFSKVRNFVGKFREIAEGNISHVQHDPLILKMSLPPGGRIHIEVKYFMEWLMKYAEIIHHK